MNVKNTKREPVVEIVKGQCKVKTLQITMSKRRRTIMLINLFTIGFVPAMSVWWATQEKSLTAIIGIACFGIVALGCSILKTLCDFNNWMFSMNIMQEKMGQSYVEDVTNICNDFIKAGCKLAAEEVSKATRDNCKTERGRGDSEKNAE